MPLIFIGGFFIALTASGIYDILRLLSFTKQSKEPLTFKGDDNP